MRLKVNIYLIQYIYLTSHCSLSEMEFVSSLLWLHENLETVRSREPFCLRRTSVMMPDLKGNQLTLHPSASRNRIAPYSNVTNVPCCQNALNPSGSKIWAEIPELCREHCFVHSEWEHFPASSASGFVKERTWWKCQHSHVIMTKMFCFVAQVM